MWFISLVFKNIWRRKIRSFLTATSMAVAVCAVISMLGAAEGYEQSFSDLYNARDVDLVIVRGGVTQRVASMLDATIGDRIAALDGVKAVEGTLVDLHSIPEKNLVAVYIFGVPHNTILAEESKLKEGRKLTLNDRRKVVMGQTLARNLGKKFGDKVEFYGETFEIVGVFDSFNLLESNGAVMPMDELQEILGKKDQVTTFLVMLQPSYKTPEKVQEIREEIEAMRHPSGRSLNLEVQTTQDHVRTNFETQMMKGLAWISSTIAMLIGFISMLNTMMMSITERIREIATFRAIGWRKLRVMRMIILEALLLSSLGSLIGLLIAFPLMEFLTWYSVTSTVVVSRLTLETIAKGLGMGVLAGLLGSVYPAWIAAQLSPASALRYE